MSAAYLIQNHGPERARFDYQIRMSYRECQGCEVKNARKEGRVTLDSGADTTVDVYALCNGSNSRPCVSTSGHVTTIGLDPNMANTNDSKILQGL